jgi:membrane associated rhomboid family serine protease
MLTFYALLQLDCIFVRPVTVGASGGIFGLIGACLSDIMMNWKLLFSDFVTENGKRNSHALVLVFLLLDIALNCIIGLTRKFTTNCLFRIRKVGTRSQFLSLP